MGSKCRSSVVKVVKSINHILNSVGWHGKTISWDSNHELFSVRVTISLDVSEHLYKVQITNV